MRVFVGEKTIQTVRRWLRQRVERTIAVDMDIDQDLREKSTGGKATTRKNHENRYENARLRPEMKDIISTKVVTNPRGSDGNVMKCQRCNSEYHLIASCLRRTKELSQSRDTVPSQRE